MIDREEIIPYENSKNILQGHFKSGAASGVFSYAEELWDGSFDAERSDKQVGASQSEINKWLKEHIGEGGSVDISSIDDEWLKALLENAKVDPETGDITIPAGIDLIKEAQITSGFTPTDSNAYSAKAADKRFITNAVFDEYKQEAESKESNDIAGVQSQVSTAIKKSEDAITALAQRTTQLETWRSGFTASTDPSAAFAEMWAEYVKNGDVVTSATISTYADQFKSGITLTADHVSIGSKTLDDILTVDGKTGKVTAKDLEVGSAAVTGRLTTSFEKLEPGATKFTKCAVTFNRDSAGFALNDGDSNEFSAVDAYLLSGVNNADVTRNPDAKANGNWGDDVLTPYDAAGKLLAGCAVLPCFGKDGFHDKSLIGTRVVLSNMLGTSGARINNSLVVREDGQPIYGFPSVMPSLVEWRNGIIELLCVPGTGTSNAYLLNWVVVNYSGEEVKYDYTESITIND